MPGHFLQAQRSGCIGDIRRGGEQVNVATCRRADFRTNPIDQCTDIVLNAAFFFVNLFRGNRVTCFDNLGSFLRGAQAKAGQSLGQSSFHSGLILYLGAFRDIVFQPVEEMAFGEVIASIQR